MSWRGTLFFWALFFSTALIRTAHAYPSFIGYGYTSCIVCHFNAFGGGPLTDYGRAVGFGDIAARTPFSNATDEQTGEASGFLGSTKLPKFLRAQFDYRGMYYKSDLIKPSPGRYIQMQADGAVIIRRDELNDLYALVSIGYAPSPNAQPSLRDHLVSHAHYVSYQPRRSLRIYAGFMDQVYGIRIPDHVAFSRSKTGLSFNDQTHGAAMHFAGSQFESGLQVFAGSLFQSPALRQKGVSGTFEVDAAEKWRVGASALYSQNSFRSRELVGIHSRVGTSVGSSVLFETGFIHDRVSLTEKSLGNYAFLQTSSRLNRGLHLLITTEYYTQKTFAPVARTIRFAPGLQYFFMPRVEFRFDLQVLRQLGPFIIADDKLNLQAQVHLCF